MKYTTATVKAFCEEKECLWFMDLIASYQTSQFKQENEFQVWKLTKRKNGSAKITCEDGNDNILKTQIIPYTDFEDKEVIFWLENEVLFFPSER